MITILNCLYFLVQVGVEALAHTRGELKHTIMGVLCHEILIRSRTEVAGLMYSCELTQIDL